MNYMMTDEEFINYCMDMHYLTPDQKLIYLKQLVDSMQKDYVKPSFIVTSEEELNQNLKKELNPHNKVYSFCNLHMNYGK